MIAFIAHCIRTYRQQKAERREEAERATVAAHFNNLYTYNARYLGREFAWMCPKCHKIHEKSEYSVFSGNQFPACCDHGEGHRLHCGIRIRA